MTVSDQISSVTYTTNGVSGNFAFNHPFLTASEILVTYRPSSGSEVVWVLNTDYTISGTPDANGNYSGGATVVASSAPPSGGTVTIDRNSTASQGADYATADSFPAEVHEGALDKLTLLVQELKSKLSRALVQLPTAGLGQLFLPLPEDGKALIWQNDVLVNSEDEIDAVIATATSAVSTAVAAAGSAQTAATSASASAATATSAAASVNFRNILTKSASYTVVLADKNNLVDYTGSGGHTIDMDAAVVGTGFEFVVRHSGSGTLTINPAGAQTIDGSATIALTAGQAVVIVCDGSNFKVTVAKGYGAGAGTVTSVATGTGLTGGTITGSGTLSVVQATESALGGGEVATDQEARTGSSDTTLVTPLKMCNLLLKKGTTTASAGTLTLPDTGNYIEVSGTTTINGMTPPTGALTGWEITLQFQGALQLTYNATSFILPSSANITTAAGDVAVFRYLGSGNWKCTGYTRQNGQALVTTGGSGWTTSTAPVQNIAANSGYTWPHGLGATPKVIWAELICINAGGDGAFTYLSGAYHPAMITYRTASTAHGFMAVNIGSSTVKLMQANDSSNVFFLPKPDGTGLQLLDNSKWQIYYKAAA